MNFLLQQMIDAAAERNSASEAIRFLDQSLTYAELARKSNCLAHTLVECGVRRRDRVGIYMNKSLEMSIALYGIMKAGAAYVPLDIGAPVDRVSYVLRDCGIRHLVTDGARLGRLQRIASKNTDLAHVIGVGAHTDLPFQCHSWDEVFAAASGAPPDVKIIEKDLAYIIYTSGSTGVPKGIMHTHHSALAFARWAAREYGFGPDDRLSNHAPLHFDLSTLDYFAGAVAGASTSIIPEEHTKLPASYSKLLADQRLTVFYTVPFALIQILLGGMLEQRDLSALRWIIYGGEPFPTKHLRALMAKLPHVRFDNIYGPAEVNGCTHYSFTSLADSEDSVPIGRIADIADALVVDDAGEEVVAGESGELLVRTPTMMQGYWGRPDLNERAFYRRQIFADFEDVFYRTGDLVREGSDGVFRFLGRKDRQIKVRGYRIELDEIEAALSAIAAVEEAAAFAVPDAEGSQRIHGAVVLRPRAQVTSDEIVRHLKERLPWYAVPSAVLIREDFPRTSTGKIDRRHLREEAVSGAAERVA